MPSAYISVEQQRQIIERANRRCEYCKSSMDYASQSFVMEHIIPVSAGGETSLTNLALACGGCNGHIPVPKLTIQFKPWAKLHYPSSYKNACPI